MQRPWVTSAAYEAALAVITEARKSAGLSQRDLAERLQKPRSFVSKIENKERRVDVVELVALARAIGLEPSDLMARIAAVLPAHVEF